RPVDVLNPAPLQSLSRALLPPISVDRNLSHSLLNLPTPACLSHAFPGRRLAPYWIGPSLGIVLVVLLQIYFFFQPSRQQKITSILALLILAIAALIQVRTGGEALGLILTYTLGSLIWFDLELILKKKTESAFARTPLRHVITIGVTLPFFALVMGYRWTSAYLKHARSSEVTLLTGSVSHATEAIEAKI